MRERFVAMRLGKTTPAPFRSQQSYGMSPTTFGTAILVVTPAAQSRQRPSESLEAPFIASGQISMDLSAGEYAFVEVQDTGAGSLPTFEIPGMPGAQMGMVNLGDIFGKAFGGLTKPRRMTVSKSHDVLIDEEADKLLDEDAVVREAIEAVEQNGIVFLDEIDKISVRSDGPAPT